jgi:hypothetical protein
MDGVTTTVKVAHVRLCHPRETQEIVFDAHDRLSGDCGRGVYDNLWTPPAAQAQDHSGPFG